MISGHTSVFLLNSQRYTIKELDRLVKQKQVSLWLLSLDLKNKSFAPDKITEVFQEEKELFRVFFDNKRFLDCTADQLLMNVEGSFVSVWTKYRNYVTYALLYSKTSYKAVLRNL